MGSQIQQPTGTPPANQGGTVRPVYGERRPVMYHLFDTEMDSVSAFNAQALFWSSLGSLFLNSVIGIVIGYCFAPQPLSDIGFLMVHRVAPFVGVAALICFGAAVWSILSKNKLVNKIKKETRTESGLPVS
jgi:hypothetical protein